MKRKYKHLLFDLDHTLWDHKANANETLGDLYRQYSLEGLTTIGVDDFQEAFHRINFELWHDYHIGKVDQHFIRNQRFKKVLELLGVMDFQYHIELSQDYLAHCPRKSNLMPFAMEALEYLKTRYHMSVITNGFAEIQDIKLASSGLTSYFETVITSDQTGRLKPHPEIFKYALSKVGVSPVDCVMIGDNPDTDIEGAKEVGIDQIYYDPEDNLAATNPTYRIQSLLQLKELL